MTDNSPRSLRLIVDAEVFEVVEMSDHPGGYRYLWVSGPNPGYGFTAVVSTGHKLSVEEHTAAIRDFLESINPETGYLD